MKVSYLLEKLIILILLVETKFIYLIPVPSFISKINNAHQKIIVVMIIITIVLLLSTKLLNQRYMIFTPVVLIFIGIYIIEIMLSYTNYDQGVLNAFIASNYYLIPISYFIYSYYFRRDNGLEKFKNIFINFTIVLSILFLIQYILINFNIKFLQIDFEQVRFGDLRIYESGNHFIKLGLIFASSNILSSRYNKKDIITVALCTFNMIFIAKGRMAMIVIFISLLSMIMYKNKNDIVKFISTMVILIIIGILALQTDIAKTYIEASKVVDASYTNRTKTIDMYIEQISKNPIWGMGFIRDMEDSESTKLLTGPMGTYTRTDVGIIGFTNCFGLVGFIWYIGFIFSSIFYIIKIKKIVNKEENLDLIGILVMIIVSSISLIVTDASRIFLVPIFMANIDCLYYKNIIKNEQLKQNRFLIKN